MENVGSLELNIQYVVNWYGIESLDLYYYFD
jgi:hypothetical protein